MSALKSQYGADNLIFGGKVGIINYKINIK